MSEGPDMRDVLEGCQEAFEEGKAAGIAEERARWEARLERLRETCRTIPWGTMGRLDVCVQRAVAIMEGTRAMSEIDDLRRTIKTACDTILDHGAGLAPQPRSRLDEEMDWLRVTNGAIRDLSARLDAALSRVAELEGRIEKAVLHCRLCAAVCRRPRDWREQLALPEEE